MREPKLKRSKSFLFNLLALPVSFSFSAHAQIEKCQDELGKWHYGDSAAAACAESKITVLDKKGVKVKEIDRPPSHEEVEAREAEKKRLQEQAAYEKERAIARQRILRVYPDEASIHRARDQRIEGLDKNITLNEELLGELRLRKKKLDDAAVPKDEKAKKRQDRQKLNVQNQIDQYSGSISQLREDREKVQKKYSNILDEFYDLTGTGPAQTGAAN
jgi:hypothetical protein